MLSSFDLLLGTSLWALELLSILRTPKLLLLLIGVCPILASSYFFPPLTIVDMIPIVDMIIIRSFLLLCSSTTFCPTPLQFYFLFLLASSTHHFPIYKIGKNIFVVSYFQFIIFRSGKPTASRNSHAC